MTTKNNENELEIYDMSVNNPLAQSFLEKSAFLKFLIQQIKRMITADGDVEGDISKYNTFVTQISRVRTELYSIKKDIQDEIDKFKSKLEEINYRRRYSSQLIMHLTRERTNGEIDQDTYHHRKYELEMKRKSLGNQITILNKNISIYNNLLNSMIPKDEFEQIEEDFLPSDDLEKSGALSEGDLLMENSTDGITYMGILSTDLEKAIADKQKERAALEAQEPRKIGQARLNIITETGRQYFFPLSAPSIVRIGRGSQNDIQIPSPAVSRNHAEIRFETDHYYVVDLESSNGTFVNDKMVMRRKIEPNDTISIGGTRLVYLE